MCGLMRAISCHTSKSARLTFRLQESEAGTEGSSIVEAEYRLPESLQEDLKVRLESGEFDEAAESPVAESTVTAIRRSTAAKKGNKTGIESNDSDSSLSEDQAEPSVVETEDEPGELLRVTGTSYLSLTHSVPAAKTKKGGRTTRRSQKTTRRFVRHAPRIPDELN